jgi:tRNA pseudouridine32 synthase/23S rRNA pseudouridine746 synthase
MEKVGHEGRMSYKSVFQNEHFIIVDKSPNVLSVPSRLGKAETRLCLGHILEKDLGKTIYPVHRLDFEVQGLILYALTPLAQKAGNAWFEQKTIKKTYSALTKSIKKSPADFAGEKSAGDFLIGEEMKWTCKLLRGKKRAYESPHGKDSETRAKLEFIDESGLSHWELSPITGRSHQLRYELYRHNEPIVGDVLYGSTSPFHSEGIALRAFKIDFSLCLNRELFLLPEIILLKSF